MANIKLRRTSEILS